MSSVLYCLFYPPSERKIKSRRYYMQIAIDAFNIPPTSGVLAHQKKLCNAILMGTLVWKCSFIKKRNVISTLECKFLRHKGFLAVF